MKRILFVFVLLGLTLAINAQTVYLYTPKGSQVYAFQSAEMSAYDIAYCTSQYQNAYPMATVLANASNTYNCHSYAWNMTESGVTCWLNQSPDLHKYWDDGSYMETTESLAEKIFYYNGDHSAIKLPLSGMAMYESKWGLAPLMRHPPGYGPSDYNMSYRRYYIRKPIITGPYYFCTNATFTVTNTPLNYEWTWTCSSNLSPGATSGNSKTFTATSGGYGWVAINVGSTELVRHNVAVSTGTPSSINVTITPISSSATVRAIVSTSSASFPDAYEWICDGWTVTPVYESGVPSGEHVLLTRQSSYDPVMIVRVHNVCGWNYKPVTIMPSYLSASPNPASNLLNIEIEDLQPAIANAPPIQQSPPTGKTPSTALPPQPVYEVKIFNTATGAMVYQQTMTGKSKQIDVSGLPNGIYTLSVSDGSCNPPMTQQIVVAH